jgi:hypothetical protein
MNLIELPYDSSVSAASLLFWKLVFIKLRPNE